jgi:hypothetical protein
MQLEPCPSCHRHVRTDETVCPFCAASIETAMATASPRALPDRRLGRAALVSFGLSVAAVGGAAALEACDNGDIDAGWSAGDGLPTPHQQTDAGKVPTKDAGSLPSVQPVYGAPIQPVDRDAGKRSDAGNIDAATSDAGRADAGDAGDGGALGKTDAAVQDAGLDAGPPRVVAVYGAPAQPK